ncbi:MAG TPA: hypothetical protein VGC27_06135, partial [Rhizomicrobium sp.]
VHGLGLMGIATRWTLDATSGRPKDSVRYCGAWFGVAKERREAINPTDPKISALMRLRRGMIGILAIVCSPPFPSAAQLIAEACRQAPSLAGMNLSGASSKKRIERFLFRFDRS